MAIRKYGVLILITLFSVSLFVHRNQTMQIAGVTCNYIVHAPSGFNQPAILVLHPWLQHGCGIATILYSDG